MEKSILIIGAGIAGLSAGCYARMNGYPADIFELHDQPGGLCTSWRRKDYVIDGCLEWLVGSSPASNFYNIWLELGALQGRRIVDHEEFARIQGKGGKTLIFYTNVDRLEKHLLELSPADAAVIKQLTDTIRQLARTDIPLGVPKEIAAWTDTLKFFWQMRPLLLPFWRWGKTSIQSFSARFQDPFLRETFPLPFDLPDFPMLFVLVTLAWMHNKTAGYPIGGSLEFSKAIEKRFLDLGGKIHYKSRVAKILVENHRAAGVRLTDGSEHRAEVVISAADGHATIFEMLEGKYTDAEIRGYYEKMPKFKSLVQVSLGVDRDLSAEPHTTGYVLDQPITVAGEPQKGLMIENFAMDPTLAPPGKTVVMARFMSDQKFWKEIYADRKRYQEEKQKIADLVLGLVESKYPGISEQVEMMDVATPMTFERYTGNWEGSMEGWLITTRNMFLRMKRTLPGLDNFFMIGQWVQPGGGVPTGAMHGREILQVICRREGRPFVTSRPPG